GDGGQRSGHRRGGHHQLGTLLPGPADRAAGAGRQPARGGPASGGRRGRPRALPRRRPAHAATGHVAGHVAGTPGHEPRGRRPCGRRGHRPRGPGDGRARGSHRKHRTRGTRGTLRTWKGNPMTNTPNTNAPARPDRDSRGVLRRLTADDLPLVLSWRNHPDVRRFMYTRHEISAEEHARWFAEAEADPSRHLLAFAEKPAEKPAAPAVPRGFVPRGLAHSSARFRVVAPGPGAPRGVPLP